VAKPYHGQSNNIERLFGIYSEFERSMITHIGTSIEPPRLLRNEKFHRMIYQKCLQRYTSPALPGQLPGISLEEAHYMIALWFEKYITVFTRKDISKDTRLYRYFIHP
jgi:hypothetical protein